MPLPRIHPLLACIFFAWQPTGTGWCQAPPPLQLLPQVAVDGTGVFMSQLVVGGGTNTAWHVRLCDAPAPGRSLVLPMHQVRSLVDKHLPAASTPFWAGPQVVQITRRMRTLQAQELLSALTARLREISLLSEGELDVRFARPWTPAPIADEPFELRLHPLPASGITPITQVKADLLAGDESIASWLLPVEIRLWKPAWVCRKALKKGQTLTSDDVELERRDVLRSVSALHPESLDFGQGWQMAENLNPGQPLLVRSLQPRVVVAKGQLIDALYRDGVLSIGMKAEAMENGASGQVIRVRNPGSRREMRGKVINDQTVQIQM